MNEPLYDGLRSWLNMSNICCIALVKYKVYLLEQILPHYSIICLFVNNGYTSRIHHSHK